MKNPIAASIIQKISPAYPDGMLIAYLEKPNINHGDGLAKFIVNEIHDVTLDVDSPSDAIEYARRAMNSAIAELTDVSNALSRLDEENGKIIISELASGRRKL